MNPSLKISCHLGETGTGAGAREAGDRAAIAPAGSSFRRRRRCQHDHRAEPELTMGFPYLCSLLHSDCARQIAARGDV